jgi:hypothetical protein
VIWAMVNNTRIIVENKMRANMRANRANLESTWSVDSKLADSPLLMIGKAHFWPSQVKLGPPRASRVRVTHVVFSLRNAI